MNILIVAHQPLIRRGIIEILSSNKEAFSYYEAGNPAEAMLAIQAQEIDLVLIDLRLNTDDGLDLVGRLKQTGKNHTKYILLLQSMSIFEFKRAKELQIDGYILKDSLVEDILYAFQVIRRGEKFYPSKIIEKAFNNSEADGLRLLTEREMDVFRELRKGLTNGQISSNLFITEGTTKKHISNILNKLKLSNRTEVVIYANKLYGSQNQ